MRKEFKKFAPKIREIESAMRKREAQIEVTKDDMNTVENRVFAAICKKIRVSNIRQYEEREMKINLSNPCNCYILSCPKLPSIINFRSLPVFRCH